MKNTFGVIGKQTFLCVANNNMTDYIKDIKTQLGLIF